jgi:hypothetical protein
MMREGIFRHWQIIAATVFSLMLIVGAYVFAQGVESPQIAQASTETALLQAIATKDSTGDGLPDWEKSLYGIPLDATTTDYFHLGMTDGEAVAKGLVVPNAVANIPGSAASSTEGTLTNAFAENFFNLYLSAKEANGGAALTSDQTNTLATQALSEIPQSAAQATDARTTADIKVSGSGPDALRAFAVAAEAVFKKNMSTATTSEIQSLQDAVNGDTGALTQLSATAQVYRKYAAGLAALPVPQELAADDLALINTMLLRSAVDDDFTQVNTDPLTTILALQQFSQTESDFWNEFSDIGAVYTSYGVTLAKGMPGASFVNVIANAHPVMP